MIKTIASAFLLASTLSAQASVLNCRDNVDVRQEVLRPRYTVKVTELENITNKVPYGRNYDSVLRVRVDLKVTLGSRLLENRAFEAIARTEDVMYNVSAVREQGFKFWTYLDELDQSGIELTDRSGRKTEVQLTCF